MDILKLVKEILGEERPYEKDYLLESLSQILEHHHGLNEADIIEGVRLLLAAALQEENKEVRETFFSTIENTVVHRDIGDCIDWGTLAASLSDLGQWELDNALHILGLSGQAR